MDKNGHPRFRDLDSFDDSKPDFLVHIPGQDKNLLVVEVKPANAKKAQIAKDLKKLAVYMRDLKDEKGRLVNYKAAYLWLYGLEPARWEDGFRDAVLKSKKDGKMVLNSADIRSLTSLPICCFVQPHAMERAVKVRWS